MSRAVSLENFIKCYITEGADASFVDGCRSMTGVSCGREADEIFTVKGAAFMEDWADGPYRHVWVHNEERAIITYCEGDISVQVYETQAAYDLAVFKSHQFYATH